MLDGDYDVSDESSRVNIDDDDYVDIDVDSESEDETRSSFPKNKNPSMNMIIGGPQARSTEGMTKSEAKTIMDEDKRIRKRWTDNQRILSLKKNSIGSPPCDKAGDDSYVRWPMSRSIICTWVTCSPRRISSG